MRRCARARRHLPGGLLRRASGAGTPTSSARDRPSRPRQLVLRRRRHQARPPPQGARATADGRLRRASAAAPGRPAAQLSVVTGDGVERPWRLVDVRRTPVGPAHGSRIRSERPPDDRPDPVAHCDQCRWASSARAGGANRPPVLRGGDARDAAAKLESGGHLDVAQLADAAPDDLRTRDRRRRSSGWSSRPGAAARAPHTSRPTSCSARTRAMGYCGCPSPIAATCTSTSRPTLRRRGGGPGVPRRARRPADGFTAFWAHASTRRRALVRELIDRITAAWARPPGMHVYHYAAYEVAALKRLTARYGVREAELDALLRAERFVDLYPVVRQCDADQQESYSIKKLEAFYWGTSAGRTTTSPTRCPASSPTRSGWSTGNPRSSSRSGPTTRTTSTPPARCTVAGGAAGRARDAARPARPAGAAEGTAAGRGAHREPRPPSGR